MRSAADRVRRATGRVGSGSTGSGGTGSGGTGSGGTASGGRRWGSSRSGSTSRATGEADDRERGTAIVDFALVSALLALVFAGVVQLTLAVHVRNTLVDCAAEGARHAALADRTPADGVARTRALIGASLAAGYGDRVTAVETELGGLPVIEVRVTAPLPVVGLLGPGGMLTVSGHALQEEP